MPYIPPARRKPTAFAAATRRILKIPSGISGSSSRHSQMRKNASSAPAKTSRPIVRNVPQPTTGAWEIA